MSRSQSSTRPRFLMSPPHAQWTLRGKANFRSRRAKPVDAQQARQEWEVLRAAIRAAGGEVHELACPDPALTGMPYAAEAGQALRIGEEDFFLLPQMAAAHRRGEAAHWQPYVESLGYRTIPSEHVWEGQGDVAEIAPGVFAFFFGARSSRKGAEAAQSLFDKAGFRTLLIKIREPAFHGNMAVAPFLQQGKALICPELISQSGLQALTEALGRENLAAVSVEEIQNYATNGLVIGNQLLAPHLLPERVQRLVTTWGVKVQRLALGELCEKAGGASRCLVCQL